MPVGWIVPIQKYLQGNTEVGRMIDEAVNECFTKKIWGYQSTFDTSFITHKHENSSFWIQQVDNLAVDTSNLAHHKWIPDSLKIGLKEIKNKDVMKKYMAENVEKT